MSTQEPRSSLPPDDPLRALLHNEVHARPSARIRLPALVVCVAVLNEGVTRADEWAHLKRLPVQCVKIDRSFIRDIPEQPDARALAEAIVGIGQALDLHIVAEGVENQVITDKLRALSCDEAQGYHLSRPLPLEQFNAWRLKFVETAAVQTAPTYQI